jgi:NHLM bacteriocin system ABC transporter peptidase/ATP-binding protein
MAEEKKAPPSKPPNKRIKTPTVIQMEAVECGAAALKIVLGYFGKLVPLEELRIECGVSRDGSKASNVMKAARKYGLQAKGFKYDIPNLYEVNYPCILFWNFNHFLVLEGFKGGKVFINDPGMGPRVITPEELDESFSGVCLTFEPGEEFVKGGQKETMTEALRQRLKGFESALAFVVLCGVLLVIPGLVIPTFARVFIDEFLVARRDYIIQPLILSMGLAVFVTGVLTWLQQYYLLRMETKQSLISAAEFFNHILRLPVSYFSQRFAGEIGSRVLINDKVASIIGGKLATTMLDSVLIVFYGLLMFFYDIWLTVIVMLLSASNLLGVKMAAKKRTDASRRLMQDEGKLVGTAMGGLTMIETLKATGSEPEFFGRWAGYQAKAMSAEQDLGKLTEYMSSIPVLTNTAITAVILGLGGAKVIDGEMTVGMLVAYRTLAGFFSRPLTTIVSFGAELQALEADMNRLDDVLRYPQDIMYTSEVKDTDSKKLKLSGHIELRDITFGYNPLEKPLIENFNLTIKPGQRFAFVGGSGSGKSTVGKVVAGLYEPWSGDVLFDGVPRGELPPKLIANSLGVVDQDIFLFAGSIRDNIAMWDSTVPDINITRASKDAEIAAIIETRDGAYRSLINEGGSNFSGGQRQRLEIARALVGNPTMLILDEATSALDPATEVDIDNNLRRRGCSCIIVAHRLSTIRDADQIVVMERGKIVQMGTHDELKDDETGFYAHLIKE